MIIENSRYRVVVSTVAAEIHSFYDKELKIEYMWQGDAAYWSGRNPILFPVIGSSYDKKYYFNNVAYTMGNHGFARHANFEFVSQTENAVTLRLTQNEETLKQYPFYFNLLVEYQLMEGLLQINYCIENTGQQPMPFNFGLHPAFNCPLEKNKTFEDYHIGFNNQNPVYSNLWALKKADFPIQLEKSKFKDVPTWLFTGISASEIVMGDGHHGVGVAVVGFPVVAVWTPQAPFVCLEPWLGLSKDTQQDLAFEDREATCLLAPGKQRRISYHIRVF